MEKNRERPRNPEEELLDAARSHPFVLTSGDRCVRREILRSFSQGEIEDEATRDRILSHLRGCPSCLASLKQVRGADVAKVNRKGFWRFRPLRLAIALLATVGLAMILWLWPARIPWLRPLTESVVDLREATLTRGIDIPATTISMDTTRLRIILPADAPPGTYEVAFFVRASEPAALQTTAIANASGSGTNLLVQVELRGLSSGKYILGVKNEASDWRYCPITLKKN